jgi:hypothetical protein
VRLIVKLATSDVMARFRAAHPELPAAIEERLYAITGVVDGAKPLVAAAGACDAARTGFATLRGGDADATGKAVAAGLAACACRVANLDDLAYLTAWLLEPRVGWLPITDDALAADDGGTIGDLLLHARP